MSEDSKQTKSDFAARYVYEVMRELAYIAEDPRNKVSVRVDPSFARRKEYQLYTKAVRADTDNTLLLLVLQDLWRLLGQLHEELELHKLTVSKYEIELKKAANGIRFLQFRSGYLSKLEQWAKVTIGNEDLIWLVNLRDQLEKDILRLNESTPPRQDNPTSYELVLEVVSLRKQLDEASKREAIRLHKNPKVRSELCPLLKNVSDNLFQIANAVGAGLVALIPSFPALLVPTVAAWLLVFIVKTGIDQWCGNAQRENMDRGVSIPAFNQNELRSRDSAILKTPKSLGIGIVGDVMAVIIPRDASIPTGMTRPFTTIYDDQTVVLIEVFQGESAKASDNTLLGKFHLQGITPAPAGKPHIDVTFAINPNGSLHVRAKERDTNTEKAIQITTPNIIISSRA